MASYECALRTNYFRVKDEETFKELMSRVDSEDCKVWEKEQNGVKFFSFGGYASINGVRPKQEAKVESDEDDYDDDACNFDSFLDDLMECVAEDDAVLIFEGGHEKLRYVTGSVYIVTSKENTCIDLEYAGKTLAKSLLKNPNWETNCCY